MEAGTRRPGERNWAAATLRAVGRRPLASAAGAGVLVVAGVWAWWSTQLWGLPDIGDPFDVAAFESARVPEDRNAFVEYSEAGPMVYMAYQGMGEAAPSWPTYLPVWSEAGQPWRDYVARARPALALWRAGTEKPDALYVHPEGLSYSTGFPVSQRIRSLAQLAILEGSRLEGQGDMAGAWGWHRAALRSSRHSGRHGFQVERMIGAAIHEEVVKAITRWAADPRVDPSMLRRALDEVIAIDGMTAPPSDAIKVEYLLFSRSRNDPAMVGSVLASKVEGVPADWCQELPVPAVVKQPIQAARVLAGDDRERSLRVFRLMTANWLAQVDKPPSRRTPLARRDPPIYEPDPAAPPNSRAISPEALARWYDSSLLARKQLAFLAHWARSIGRERGRQARLVVHLADQTYRREHGGPPPSPSALVGPYLKELPEGYDAVDDPPGARP